MKDLAIFSRSLIRITFFLALFITPIVFTSYTSELFEIPKALFVYAIASTFFCLYILYSFASRKILFTKNSFLIFFLLFILAMGISTIFSTDQHLSTFGYYTRLNGSLLTTICYFIIFFVTSSLISKKESIEGLKFLVISAVFVSIWGIPGHFGYDPNCFILTGKLTSLCWREEFQPTLRIFSTFGQPNWLGAFLTMTIPISLSFTLTTKGFQKIFFLASSLIILFALIFTNSRSSFLALIITFGIFFALLGFQKIKSNAISLTIFIFFALLLLGIFGKPLWERNLEAVRQNLFFYQSRSQSLPATQNTTAVSKTPASTSLESGGTESGTIRLIVWQGAFEIFKNFPILGSGPETFATLYYRYRPVEHNQTTEWNFLYNKAHNEYLNYLAGTGIVGFISYIALLISVAFLALRNIFTQSSQTKIIQIGIFSSFCSFVIVNFFGFSVITTSLIFFLIPTFIFTLGDSKKSITIKIPKKIFIPDTAIVSVIFIIFITLVLTVSRIFLSDVYYSRYQKEIGSGKILKALKNIQTAAATMPYPEPLYYSEIGYAASLAAENSYDNEKTTYTNLAENSTATALKLSPNNINLWRKAQSTYFELSLSDPKYLNLAINAGNVTVQLAPTDPAVYYNLGLIQKTAGEKDNAKKSFSKAVELKPDYIEAMNELENLKY